jgi:hypothetical protein
MMTKTSQFTRLALSLSAILCLGSSVMAGPEPMYVMINGKMMAATPMTKDVTFKSGCKVCAAGTFTDAKGKTVKIKEGQMVSSTGVLMTPAAKTAHGG